MSDHFYYFAAPYCRTAVVLPFDLQEVVANWAALRPDMVKSRPAAFNRDEWAYLISFLDQSNLLSPFRRCFGEPALTSTDVINRMMRPRGPIAVWLPGNVSLLGPLTLILLSLTGNALRLKSSSQGENMSQAFLDFALAHLPTGPLSGCLRERVRVEAFSRQDARNEEMARDAALRVVFGADAAAAAVDMLPHPTDSVGFAFANRQSQAWLDYAAIDDDTLVQLIKVFAIYGQAGCTSPQKVILLDGRLSEARLLRDRLLHLWPKVINRDLPMHVASSNVLTFQLANALGWEAALSARNGAVVAVGEIDAPAFSALMFLPITPATLEQAMSRLPGNIQTIGYALRNPADAKWLTTLARSHVKRFVPLVRMHHFGPVWDGWAFWEQAFEEIEIQQ
ncbi:hypothetical protein HUU40_17090 [candidate division KSB1 bacterium]|nr:hypothetical protein [candidate division KSB1 bacterium]